MERSTSARAEPVPLPPPPREAPAQVHRRPSGEPPPLPRELGRSGRLLIALVVVGIAVTFTVVASNAGGYALERIDTVVLRAIARLRVSAVTDVMQAIDGLAARWPLRILRWGTVLVLVATKRWRHLAVFLGVLVAAEVITYELSLLVERARPLGVQILTDWSGYAFPARPLASLAVTLFAMCYALVPAGRKRFVAKVASYVVLGVVWIARTYLGVDHLADLAFGALIGVAVPVVGFRWFAPNDAFPVTYRRGKSAHLDVTGTRGVAIRKALEDQLGVTVVDVKPVGLAGSGGSTPLRLTLAASEDEPQRYVFAKLYAANHVRADRWYKLGRTILYGALEDETRFETVRRFVEYEDYALRLLQDEGLPTPRPYGVVEITPEREYMIVMEFFHGAVELGEADVTEDLVDQGMGLIRRMWDAGIAHRDVKPANLMVQDGRLRLIDVFFVQVRPSPWRQAVDLANMMLVMALRSDARLVYEVALRHFTPEEIAEAFAATRGVASPSQVRTLLKRDDRDLLAEFRALAPPHPRIRIQRWSLRRIALTAWVGFLAFLGLMLVVDNWEAFV